MVPQRTQAASQVRASVLPVSKSHLHMTSLRLLATGDGDLPLGDHQPGVVPESTQAASQARASVLPVSKSHLHMNSLRLLATMVSKPGATPECMRQPLNQQLRPSLHGQPETAGHCLDQAAMITMCRACQLYLSCSESSGQASHEKVPALHVSCVEIGELRSWSKICNCCIGGC